VVGSRAVRGTTYRWELTHMGAGLTHPLGMHHVLSARLQGSHGYRLMTQLLLWCAGYSQGAAASSSTLQIDLPPTGRF
jgi:hypothetical protein